MGSASTCVLPDSAFAALQSIYQDKLGDKIKALESSLEQAVPAHHALVVRLDGCGFSKFTRGLVKPYDQRLTDVMVQTSKDMISKFNCSLVYTQSDEISLVFPAVMPVPGVRLSAEPSEYSTTDGPVPAPAPVKRPLQQSESIAQSPDPTPSHGQSARKRFAEDDGVVRTHIYNGRVSKICTVVASYCSVRFNFHLSQFDWSDLDAAVQRRIKSHVAYFDGRIVPCPDDRAVMEAIFWRSNFDGFRNAVSHVSHFHFHHREIQNKSVVEQLRMLQSQKDVSLFRDFSTQYLFGTWIKKEKYPVFGFVNPKTQTPVPGPVWRNRVRTGSFNWADWSEADRTMFCLAQYWTDEPSMPPKNPLAENGSAELADSAGETV
ncbi:tRNAHis guanylyltransferase-domain-containing protein [Polychytrium aggregatum]|uniref:tRNAHis guanylyltransferase-domain-containing protein n=1 Tax=Polychytrium aggregatum TaxID=110093 RepID=UPI0022FEB463|nr:tRNAHis guanylyltransferase-domain-containing protein [Polychytrium aggregatum]KAI9208323.1 tRNAHis guanylyltransferase-domain-containing protein [Polychytrium aggregatum]